MKLALSKLKKPQLGRNSQVFRFEVLVSRVEHLHPAQNTFVWVELVRGNKCLSTQAVGVEPNGCAKWNEMLMLEKRIVHKNTDTFEPKVCTLRLKEVIGTEVDAQLKKGGRKVSTVDLDLAQFIPATQPSSVIDKKFELPLHGSTAASLWLTIKCVAMSTSPMLAKIPADVNDDQLSSDSSDDNSTPTPTTNNNNTTTHSTHSRTNTTTPPPPNLFSSSSDSLPSSGVHDSSYSLLAASGAGGDLHSSPVILPARVISFLSQNQSPTTQRLLMRAIASERLNSQSSGLRNNADDPNDDNMSEDNTIDMSLVVQDVLACELRSVEDEVVKSQRARRHAEAENEQLRARLGLVEAERQGLSEQVLQLRGELTQVQTTADTKQEELEHSLQDTKLQLAKAVSELGVTKQHEVDLQTNLQELQGRFETLERESANAAHVAEETVQRLTREASRLKEKAAELQSQLEAQQQQLQQLGTEDGSLFSNIFPNSDRAVHQRPPSTTTSEADGSSAVANEDPALVLSLPNTRTSGQGDDQQRSSDSFSEHGSAENNSNIASKPSVQTVEAAQTSDTTAQQQQTPVEMAKLLQENTTLQKRLDEMALELDSFKHGNSDLRKQLRASTGDLQHEVALRKALEDTLSQQQQGQSESNSHNHEAVTVGGGNDTLGHKLAVALAERDDARSRLTKLSSEFSVAKAHMTAEQTVLTKRTNEAEAEMWKAIEEKESAVQQLTRRLADTDLQVVGVQAEARLWSQRCSDLSARVDSLSSELTKHVSLPQDCLLAIKVDAANGATKALQYYKHELDRIASALAKHDSEKQQLVDSVRKLTIQCNDLKMERTETFAQVEADQRIFNRRIRNLEAELQRASALRDTLTKRTHNLRVERDKVVAQAKADHVVLLSTLNGVQTQLRQSKSLCDALRQKFAEQHEEYQQKLQQKFKELDVMTEQLRRIHEEYHEEETRMRAERDDALQALRRLQFSPTLATAHRTSLRKIPFKIKGVVDHFFTIQSSDAPTSPPHSPNSPPLSPTFGVSEGGNNSGESGAGTEGTVVRRMKRQNSLPGSMERAAVVSNHKQKPELGAEKSGTANSDVENRLRRAEADVEELQETLKQTVEHLVQVISEKERVLHELKETRSRSQPNTPRDSATDSHTNTNTNTTPNTNTTMSRTSTSDLPASPEAEELRKQIKKLRSENEVLSSTTVALGDHLCKVITEREDQHLQISLERDALKAQLSLLQQHPHHLTRLLA